MFVVINQIIPELVGFSCLPADERFLHVLDSRPKLPFSPSVVVISQILLVRQGLQGDERILPELLLPIMLYLLSGHDEDSLDDCQCKKAVTKLPCCPSVLVISTTQPLSTDLSWLTYLLAPLQLQLQQGIK